MGRNYKDFFSEIISNIAPNPSNNKRTNSTVSTDHNNDIDPKKIATDVESTWLSNRKLEHTNKTSSSFNMEEHKINWSRQTTNRNRDKRPNKKGGYGHAHSTFYKLPYETMAEYRKEKNNAERYLKPIPEKEELSPSVEGFMAFDRKKPEIDKNHIKGIHEENDKTHLFAMQRSLRQQIQQDFFASFGKRKTSQMPTIGFNRVSKTNLYPRVRSDSSLFTEIPSIKKRRLTRNGSITENLNNLDKEQNAPEETPKHAEKIEMGRAKSDSDIEIQDCNWGNLDKF